MYVKWIHTHMIAQLYYSIGIDYAKGLLRLNTCTVYIDIFLHRRQTSSYLRNLSSWFTTCSRNRGISIVSCPPKPIHRRRFFGEGKWCEDPKDIQLWPSPFAQKSMDRHTTFQQTVGWNTNLFRAFGKNLGFCLLFLQHTVDGLKSQTTTWDV